MSNLHSTNKLPQQTLDELRLRIQQIEKTQQANSPAAKSAVSSTNQQVGDLSQRQVDLVIAQARDTHHLVIEWVRSLDAKISPILTANSALIAGILAVLSQQELLLKHHPITNFLLASTLLPLLYSLLMSISAISPSLKWGQWGKNRHRPDASNSEPTSTIFFGQISRFDSAYSYAEKAKSIFADPNALLEDILNQTFINAEIATNKSQHIALSTRGLFFSIFLLLAAGISFVLK